MTVAPRALPTLRRREGWPPAPLWIAALLVAAICAVPPAYLLIRAGQAPGTAWDVLTARTTFTLAARSLLLAASVTALATAIALPLAWLTARSDLPARRAIGVLAALPLAVPSYVGAMVAISGAKTGRSPKDKRIVDHPTSRDNIWWGDVNIPLSPDSFEKNRRIARHRFGPLVGAIQAVLNEAIQAGGTTLKDFVGADGRPGYFERELLVYGRKAEPCVRCATPIKHRLLGQRATYYCPQCQR